MRETLIGLAMAALTGLVYYLIGRRRYRCPWCGRIVRWQDLNCPHCGQDMKSRHRAGPAPRRGIMGGPPGGRGRI